jgi:hypothetical protein
LDVLIRDACARCDHYFLRSTHGLSVADFLHLNLARHYFVERSPDRLRRRPPYEIDIHQRSAGKIYSIFGAALKQKAADPRRGKQQGQDDEWPLLTEEVEIRVLKDFHSALEAGIH